jgi:hypothetical protein
MGTFEEVTRGRVVADVIVLRFDETAVSGGAKR